MLKIKDRTDIWYINHVLMLTSSVINIVLSMIIDKLEHTKQNKMLKFYSCFDKNAKSYELLLSFFNTQVFRMQS
jgi:hypothetical protein